MFIEHPDRFKTGTRIILRTNRNKDDAGNSRKPKTRISFGVQDWNETVEKMENDRQENERIYATVNERDFDKGILRFKKEQVDADHQGDEMQRWFYIDSSNRFASALHKPGSRKETIFLVDIDPEDDENDIRIQIAEADTEILYEYETKNGKHILLEPFNPNTVDFEISKDGMMLVAY